MKRDPILCVLMLAAACSGGGDKKPVTAGDPTPVGGDTPPPTVPDPFDEPPVDANHVARTAFSNPGGMWLPEQMTLPIHDETFFKLGVGFPSGQLSDPLAAPLAAVVNIGGCSASFVSPDGLIVTNHHCVQGALEQASTPDNNLVENGFLAKTRAEEVTAGAAQRVYVVQALTDITDRMRSGLEDIKDAVKRKKEIEARQKAAIAECEKGRPGLRCSVTSYFAGGKFTLIENLEIKDVRLVYVPRRSIGNYGGEKDNWRWPRHTGDFSFYRAYVGKDGLPAEFSKDNEPYHPKHHLAINTDGVKDHDFVMILGYPGTTQRTATAADIRHDIEWFYPYGMQYLQQRYDLDVELLGAGGNTAIKAGVDKQRSQNYLEKYRGILAGLEARKDLIARKDALDAQIHEWAAQPGREAIKAQIEKYEAMRADKRKRARADYDRGRAYGGKLLGTALSLVRWAEERAKPDAERKPGYQDRDMARAIADHKGMAKSYDRTLDRAVLELAWKRAIDLPAAERPWLATLVGVKKSAKIDEAAIDKRLDALYAGTKLEDEAFRLDLLQNGTMKKLKASKDPYIKLAIALWPQVKAQEKLDDTYDGDVILVSPSYVSAMREVLGGVLAPDANGTLRITYGTVKSLVADNKAEANWPFTTTAQLAAKATGEDPFDAPSDLLEAIKAKKFGPYARSWVGGEVPVNFLSDLDTTNGNSGSPVLDSKGQLVGLTFDSLIDGVSSDVVFDGETTRKIQVDIRYILWLMDAVDHADHLLTEMGVKPAIE
jgi:hypothetical protein